MKRAAILVLGLLVLGASAFAPQAPEPIDTAAIARIRAEGLERSQVMDTAFWLTDRYGPRLTGSPEFEEAGDWAIKRLASWGVKNLRKERFSSGYGWSLVRFHATMTEPRVMPIIAMPKAWSPGLGQRTVAAEVVRASITNEAEAAKYRGRLRGKIVLTQAARPVRMLEYGEGTVARYDSQGGRWRAEAMTPELVAPFSPVPSAGRGRAGAASQGPPAFDVAAFFKQEGVIALFDRGAGSDLVRGGSNLSWTHQRLDGGTIFVEEGRSPYAKPDTSVPQVTVAVEHYNRMVRLLDAGVPVKVELHLQTRFTEETAARPSSFNIVGELPGTDKTDEVVLLGGHFDSWHAGTGATDNAAGVSAMMEVMRILQATGLRPRRTIRLALWGDEENGLNGSEAYVRQHLGTPDAWTPDHARHSVYLNLDNGTGPIRGVWTQRNAAAAAVFEAWAPPLRDLGVDLVSPRSVQATDHVSFDAVGIPAFQFVQERYEYTARTHHSNMDVYDRLQANDLKQTATVAAIFAWQAANRAELMPRRPAPAAAAR